MIIEALILVTLFGAGIAFVSPDRFAGRIAALISLLPLAGSAWMFLTYTGSGNVLLGGTRGFESTVSGSTLIPLGAYDIKWIAAVDGIALPLVVLSTILTTLAIVSAWTPIDERQSQFYGLVLFLEAALIGVFTALDFFVWFVFWEAVLLPMYLLIGVWGGPRRKYAAIKFLIYTNAASFVLFIGFLALIVGLDINSFSLIAITDALQSGAISGYFGLDPRTVLIVAYWALFIGFAVKVPIVPVHTWLPDAHVEAPAPVSVLLAGVLLKMGTYALVRYNVTMFPGLTRDFAEIIAVIAVVSVIYGALLALAQEDLKRVVAYSSVSSMGYVILGLVALTVYGIGGGTFQMLSHGLISGLLFMAVGVIYSATHTRMIEDISGLATRMPMAVGIFLAGAFAYMGLPLMSGFAAEVFVFIGAFDAPALAWSPVFTSVAMFGIVIVAGYLLWAMQRALFGPYGIDGDAIDPTSAAMQDIVPLLVLLGLIVALGLAPDIAFNMIEDATQPIVDASGGETR